MGYGRRKGGLKSAPNDSRSPLHIACAKEARGAVLELLGADGAQRAETQEQEQVQAKLLAMANLQPDPSESLSGVQSSSSKARPALPRSWDVF